MVLLHVLPERPYAFCHCFEYIGPNGYCVYDQPKQKEGVKTLTPMGTICGVVVCFYGRKLFGKLYTYGSLVKP